MIKQIIIDAITKELETIFLNELVTESGYKCKNGKYKVVGIDVSFFEEYECNDCGGTYIPSYAILLNVVNSKCLKPRATKHIKLNLY